MADEIAGARGRAPGASSASAAAPPSVMPATPVAPREHDGVGAGAEPRATAVAARRATSPGLAPGAIGGDAGEPRRAAWRRARAACSRASSTRKAPPLPRMKPPPSAGRSQTPANGALPEKAAELVDQEHVRPLGVVGAADQEDVGLAGGDAGMGDADRVDAGLLLAHEGARGAGDAVDDGDVAGEQVRELGEEQRRPQVAHQALVEEDAGIGGLRRPVRICPSTA